MSAALDEQRRLIEERLAQLQGFYNNPQAQQVSSYLDARASGADPAVTQETLANWLAQNADAGAAGFAMDQRGINRAMANAGLGGGGLAQAAISQSRAEHAARTRAGRSDITSRAQLLNDQARQSGIQQMQAFQAEQAQFQQQQAQQQLAYQKALFETSQQDSATTAAAETAAPTPQTDPGLAAQRTQFQGQNPFLTPGPAKPSQPFGGFAPAGTQTNAFQQDQYQRQLNSWQKQQDARQAQAADWSARQAAFQSQYGY